MENIDELVEAAIERKLERIEYESAIGAAAGIAGAGALGYLGGRATADPSQASGTVYFDHIGSSEHPVVELNVDTLTSIEDNTTTADLEMTTGMYLPFHHSFSPPDGTLFWDSNKDNARYSTNNNGVRASGYWRSFDNRVTPAPEFTDHVNIDGIAINDRRLYVGDTEPVSPDVDDLWIDNSVAFE